MKFNDSEKSNTEDSKSLKEETKEEDLRSHEEDHQVVSLRRKKIKDCDVFK